jgi:ABC-type glycerol-3-phosphate transport system permease component
VDGASDLAAVPAHYLPSLKGVMVTAVMLRMIWVANSIDVIYVMTGWRPGLCHAHPAALRPETNLRQHGLRLWLCAGGAVSRCFYRARSCFICAAPEGIGRECCANIACPRRLCGARSRCICQWRPSCCSHFGPYLWMLLTSLKPEPRCFHREAPFLPAVVTLENYVRLFQKTTFTNNLLTQPDGVASGTVLLGLAMSHHGGLRVFALSVPGRRALMMQFLLINMFPLMLLIIPLFIIMRDWACWTRTWR